MNGHNRSHAEASSGPLTVSPEVSVCESGPDTAVFLESGNTDGWIASDLTVEVRR
jgi:hypothetical protein